MHTDSWSNDQGTTGNIYQDHAAKSRSQLQSHAREVFRAVQQAKPSQADAAHGMAITYMQTGDFGQCINILNLILDDVSMSKEAALRHFDMMQQQLKLPSEQKNDDVDIAQPRHHGKHENENLYTTFGMDVDIGEELFVDDIFGEFDVLDDDDDAFEAWLLGDDVMTAPQEQHTDDEASNLRTYEDNTDENFVHSASPIDDFHERQRQVRWSCLCVLYHVVKIYSYSSVS